MNKFGKEKIDNLLRTVDGGITVSFTKADGTERKMHCTLMPSEIPGWKEDYAKSATSETVSRVWDLEKKAFRSFHYDSVFCISTINGNS